MADNRDKVRNGSALGKYGAMNLDTLTDALVDDDSTGSHAEELQQLREEVERLQQELNNRPNTPLENALIPIGENMRALGRFQFTARALICPADASQDELAQIAIFLKQAHGALQFWVGDLANAYHAHYGVASTELAAYFGIEPTTLQNWAWVCEKIESPLRNGNLDFSHHFAVAYLPDSLKGQETELLDHAEKNGLSVRDLRVYIKSLLGTKKPQVPASSLFTKERAPRLGELRTVYMKARRGDKAATETLRESVKQYRNWLDEIERSLGLK